MAEPIVRYRIRAGASEYEMRVVQNGFGGYTYALHDDKGSMGKFTVFGSPGSKRTEDIIKREVSRLTGAPQTRVEAI